MGEYLTNATSTQQGKERKVRAFIDLHSYGQLCESHPDCVASKLIHSHVPVRVFV